MRMLGRDDECRVLDGVLDDVRRGRSRSLVVRGEADMGKTALLRYLADAAPDLAVVRAAGVESEMELAFASLLSAAGRCSIVCRGCRTRSARRWRSSSG